MAHAYPNAMIPLLFAAAVSTGLTAERALQLLERDYGNITACSHDPGRSLRDVLERRQISKNPDVVLLTVYDSCLCFAQNCPFWVYRVGARTATKILESVAVDVNVVPADGAVPDIDFIAHQSAMRKNEWRYTYRNGTYVESEAWNIYRGGRKPVGRPVTLPATGRYLLTVAPVGYEMDPYGTYAFTLSIH